MKLPWELQDEVRVCSSAPLLVSSGLKQDFRVFTEQSKADLKLIPHASDRKLKNPAENLQVSFQPRTLIKIQRYSVFNPQSGYGLWQQ